MSDIILNPDKGLGIPIKTTAAKDAITSPATGSLVYDSDQGVINQYTGSAWQGVLTTAGVPASAMPAGSVIQTVNNTSVLNFATSNTSDTDTGFSVSITPTSASNKILVLYNGNWSLQASNTSWTLSLYRGATDLGEFSSGYGASGGWIASQASFFYLDSPLTTSATTYKLYVKEGALAGTVSSNLVVHSLIALEIAA